MYVCLIIICKFIETLQIFALMNLPIKSKLITSDNNKKHFSWAKQHKATVKKRYCKKTMLQTTKNNDWNNSIHFFGVT